MPNLNTTSQLSNRLLADSATLLQAALQYAAQGWQVFPLYHPLPDGSCACGMADCKSIGKHPRTVRGLKDATKDPRIITAWWKKYPQANIGLATGKASNLVVIDVDEKHGGKASLAALEAKHGKLLSLSQQTGGGLHFLYTYPTDGEIKNSVNRLAAGVDVRGEGGYIVAAPSLHASGKLYQWRNEEAVNTLPAWLLKLIQAEPQPATVTSTPPATATTSRKLAYGQSALKGEIEKVARAPEGQRNEQLFKSAATLGGLIATGCLDEATVTNELLHHAKIGGLTMPESRKTIASGIKAGKQTPREPQTTTLKLVPKENRTPAQPATPEPPPEKPEAGKYEARTTGLYQWRSYKEQMIFQQLTTFTAQVISDVIEDDGEQTKRSFEIEAQQNGRKSRFIVPASNFSSMNWVNDNLGAKAIILPKQTDHARCAIQMLSEQPKERRIFTHTGWREIEGEHCYLHGGGAISKEAVKEVEVRLPESLVPAVLPTPPTGKDLRNAYSTVLELVNLAHDEIMLPALGAVWSSVIGHADFSIWLYGITGSGKSQLAALLQSFFGQQFNADKLPGSWMSTANALEGIAHAAKDMLFVIDDFKPTGSANDRARLHRDADRLLRAQGNQAGRQRLTADITQRKTKHPRGLIFNTAEEIPQGESLVARLFVLEVQKTSIDFHQLSDQQRRASQGCFASAMAGFLRWLALHHSDALQRAPQAIAEWRDYWAQRSIATHRRYATTLGHLTYAWHLWIEAAKETNVFTASEAQHYFDRVLTALGKAGSQQDAHTQTQNPVTRFVELLQSAFASHAAHVESRDGGIPENATAWGWRKSHDHYEPKGERIGWLDSRAEELLLIPDATVRLLERHAAHGMGLGVQQGTLWMQLYEAGFIKQKDEKRRTYTVRRRVENGVQPVIVFAGKAMVYTAHADTADTEEP